MDVLTTSSYPTEPGTSSTEGNNDRSGQALLSGRTQHAVAQPHRHHTRIPVVLVRSAGDTGRVAIKKIGAKSRGRIESAANTARTTATRGDDTDESGDAICGATTERASPRVDVATGATVVVDCVYGDRVETGMGVGGYAGQ